MTRQLKPINNVHFENVQYVYLQIYRIEDRERAEKLRRCMRRNEKKKKKQKTRDKSVRVDRGLARAYLRLLLFLKENDPDDERFPAPRQVFKSRRSFRSATLAANAQRFASR